VDVETIVSAFPWGLLLIEDERGSGTIPHWTSDEAVVTFGHDALVVKVLHEQEGSVVVHVCRDQADLGSDPIFTGTIDVVSGVLSVGNALRTERLRIPVPVGPTSIQIVAHPPSDADHVDVVIASSTS
jgi:hypothetical protein